MDSSEPTWCLRLGLSHRASAAGRVALAAGASSGQRKVNTVDWVGALGQYEVLHTAAFAHLLNGPSGVEVARALTGDPGIVSVDDVPRREYRFHGRRAIDLAAPITHGGGQGWLAIEVKVDSAWRPSQLRDTVPKTCHGVLLAVGYTALAATQRDLDDIEGYVAPWRLVGPGRAAEIVGRHEGADAELRCYADWLARERMDHEDARQAVRIGDSVSHGRMRQSLEHWAYFSEVLDTRADIQQWERKSLTSGPLVTRWLTFRDGNRSGDYLEFMGEGERRRLCVKTFAPPGSGQLTVARNRLWADLCDLTPAPYPVQGPSNKDKTCTAARWELAGLTPAEAAQLAETVEKRVEASSPTS